MQYYTSVFTVDNVYLFRFFLPCEIVRHRNRKESANELAKVKIAIINADNICVIINADNIRVVIDQIDSKNTAPACHDYPQSVRQALIVTLATDGVTEVYHQMIARLHTDIESPHSVRQALIIILATNDVTEVYH